MPAPAVIRQLVERFEANLDAYRGGGYNETLLRRDFLDPFFKALGWDIDNSQDYAEAFREVIHEDAIKVGGSTKAPDYSFRIGGRRIFFLEAKKPSVYIKEEVAPAYQLRRYAWSANLPLSILSDFEEFAVYDTRLKPLPADKPSKGRLLYLTYRDYLERWDEIAAVFSKEAVLKGSFDRYARAALGKRGTATVDAEFLAQIEQWRDLLAKNLALRNPGIGARELNFAVQATIDRIVFLRICEDRGIEPLNRLQGLANGPNIYPRLAQVFREADERYNSGLFHFRSEKGRPGSADEFTLGLKIDDRLLKDLLNGLYYPESPYEFSVLPADILGQVYERFLGSVIRLTAGGQAKVEEKPEVKKAGGVYYTPTYIVDYIVKQTVGRLLESQSPRDAAKLKILDPACGSGSFLIGAYQFLLDWHLAWYAANNPEKHAKGKEAKLYRAGEGWRLTAAERKRILVNNIYGVDIDAQAVEVTKLSLLLKVLEGETDESLNAQMKLFHERALPDLDGNIKCGNSLIGPDFFDGRLDLDEDERRRINAFDWQAEFPQVFPPSPARGRGAGGEGRGGFDAVIGNPPYGAFAGSHEVAYFRSNYETPANSIDTFLLFVERAKHLLRKAGLVGMIIPSGWVSAPSAKPLRSMFLSNFQPLSFVSLPFDVFNAYIDTVITIGRTVPNLSQVTDDAVDLVVFPQRFNISSQDDFEKYRKTGHFRTWLNSKHLEFLITASAAEASLLEKIRSQPNMLGDFVLVKRGIEVFNPSPSPSGLKKPSMAFTGVLQRYVLVHGEKGFIEYSEEIQRSKPYEYFSAPRILLRQVLSRKLRLQAVFTPDPFLTNQSVQSLVMNPAVKHPFDLRGLLGILNSRLLSWYFINVNSVARRDDFPKIIIQQTRELPIPDSGSREVKPKYDKIATLVEQMLKLHRDLAAAKTAHDKTLAERQIAATDKQIDRLVYALYGLTDAEIAVVEGSGAAA